ncbi:major capsid protein [Bacillus sp. CGMCC 1.16541]|uniref:major capsid protein n=1 Tax=Bacillus sp. CGMCC 1.16541 TaxID=2185143 RepID=UPI000D72AB5A|nr:major capsid protein [Bacillus sp. CGMCC 1.16541]
MLTNKPYTPLLALDLQFFAGGSNQILALEEFSRESLIGYVEALNLPFNPKLTKFLPKGESKVWTLDFAYDIIQRSKGAAASIIPFGMPAPLRDGRGVERVMQEVAKIAHSRKIDEREQLKFMNPRNEQERQQVIDKVFNMVDDLTLGVYKAEEWLRAAALYYGAFVHEDKANGVILNIDFGIAADRKVVIAGTDAFDQHETAKPLEALIEYAITFKNKSGGRMPAEIHMSSSVMFDILKAENTVRSIKGANGGSVTPQELTDYLMKFSLPPIVTNDDVVYFEEIGVTKRFLPERRIAFLGFQDAAKLGDTVEGPTVKNEGQPGLYVHTRIDDETDAQFIEVGEAAFPALEQPDGVFHLDV